MINSKKYITSSQLDLNQRRDPSTVNINFFESYVLESWQDTTLNDTCHVSSLWSHLLVFVVNKVINNIMLQPHRNLSQLPNFAFSVALAHFHSSKQEGETKRADEMVSDSIIFIVSLKENQAQFLLDLLLVAGKLSVKDCLMQLHSHGYAFLVKAGFLQTSTTCITVLQYDMFLVSL